MFTLTERITVSDGNFTQATIDIGSYVDVGDRQAIQVHSVDYVFQGTQPKDDLVSNIGTGLEVGVQVLDLNRGELVFADDRSLISSAKLAIDTVGGVHEAFDMYPDNYGKGSESGRYVVNDQLYIGCRTSTAPASAFNVTVRVNASIVSLSAKDFMAIAIQSTAADN